MTAYIESEEQRAKRRIRDRIRAAKKRAAMTQEQRKAVYAARAEYQRSRRLAMSPEERFLARRQMWLKYHGESYRKRAAEYMRTKRRTDPSFAIAERLRARIKTASKRAGAMKSEGTEALTGCTAIELVAWLESQFMDGMSWSNRGDWHIDHIIPCSAFNLLDDSQQRVAFHYTNLRPLWKHENHRKSSKIPVPQKKFLWTLGDVRAARDRLGLLAHPAATRGSKPERRATSRSIA